jgi:hypothetical protein
VAEGRSLRRIESDDPDRRLLFPCDFAGPGLVLTNQNGAKGSLLRIWDVATGIRVREFDAPVSLFGMTTRALSPGRRYLAILHQKANQVVLCDLVAGKVSAEWALPRHDPLRIKSWWALGFSQDGRSLYALYFSGLDFYLADWDVVTGKANTRLVRGLKLAGQNGPLIAGYQGLQIEGLADGHVLMAGQIIIDPRTGTVVRTLPGEQFEGNVRRIFDKKWACVTGAEWNRRLVVEPLPPR